MLMPSHVLTSHGVSSAFPQQARWFATQGDFTGLLHSLNPLGETEKKATKVC